MSVCACYVCLLLFCRYRYCGLLLFSCKFYRLILLRFLYFCLIWVLDFPGIRHPAPASGIPASGNPASHSIFLHADSVSQAGCRFRMPDAECREYPTPNWVLDIPGIGHPYSSILTRPKFSHTHTHSHTNTLTPTHAHPHKHGHTHTNTQRNIHRHTHKHTNTLTYTYTHEHMLTHTRTHINTNTHTHRHRHTLPYTKTWTDTPLITHVYMSVYEKIVNHNGKLLFLMIRVSTNFIRS